MTRLSLVFFGFFGIFLGSVLSCDQDIQSFDVSIGGAKIDPSQSGTYSFSYSNNSITFYGTKNYSSFSVAQANAGAFCLWEVQFSKANYSIETSLSVQNLAVLRIQDSNFICPSISMVSGNIECTLSSFSPGSTPSPLGSASSLILGSGEITNSEGSWQFHDHSLVFGFDTVLLASENITIVSESNFTVNGFFSYAGDNFTLNNSTVLSKQRHCTTGAGLKKSPVMFNTFVSQDFYEKVTTLEAFLESFVEIFDHFYSASSQVNLTSPSFSDLLSFYAKMSYGALFISKNSSFFLGSASVIHPTIGIFTPNLFLEGVTISADHLGCPSDTGLGNGTRSIIIGNNCAGNGGSHAGIGGTGLLSEKNSEENLSEAQTCSTWSRYSQMTYGNQLNPTREVNQPSFSVMWSGIIGFCGNDRDLVEALMSFLVKVEAVVGESLSFKLPTYQLLPTKLL